MRKALVAVGALGLVLAVAPAASADPVPPGKTIRDACGASFGQLVGPAKAAGTATHPNYRGGAKALLPFAALHGCG
ncbi:MAG TPA: hypothetical protein VK894_11850 [Jiangellales bacterium]|nr:hypothetical protein [Jiangellales bacterium]